MVADAKMVAAKLSAKLQEVERCKLDLEYSRIAAPIAGRIGRAMLTEGNLVNAGGSDPVLTTIVAIGPMYVDFNVDERAMQHYQEVGAGRTRQKSLPLREQNIPFYFGLDTEKGYPHEGASFSPTTSTRRARAQSSSAAPPRTPMGGSFPAPASACACR